MCIDTAEEPISKKGRAWMGASLVRQAKKFKLAPGGSRELMGWECQGGKTALTRKVNQSWTAGHTRGRAPELRSWGTPARWPKLDSPKVRRGWPRGAARE